MQQQFINQAQLVYIKDLKPQMRNLTLHVIVLDIGKPTITKDGFEVRSVRVADRTGCINLSVWNQIGQLLKEGDILRLTGCFTQIWKLTLQLKIHPKGSLSKCGDFMMVFSEVPDMSQLTPELLKMVQEQQVGPHNKLNQNNNNNSQSSNSPNNQLITTNSNNNNSSTWR